MDRNSCSFLLTLSLVQEYTAEAEPCVPPSLGLGVSVWVLWEADTEMGLELDEIYWWNICEGKRKEPEEMTLWRTEEGVNKKSLRSQSKARKVQPGPWRVMVKVAHQQSPSSREQACAGIPVTCSHWLGADGGKCGLNRTQDWIHRAVARAVDQLCSLKQETWVAHYHAPATVGQMRTQDSNQRAHFHT